MNTSLRTGAAAVGAVIVQVACLWGFTHVVTLQPWLAFGLSFSLAYVAFFAAARLFGGLRSSLAASLGDHLVLGLATLVLVELVVYVVVDLTGHWIKAAEAVALFAVGCWIVLGWPWLAGGGGRQPRRRRGALQDLHAREQTYTPGSEVRHPLRLLEDMSSDAFVSRELAWRLFVRDTAAQYRQSVLGYFWIIIPPLTTSIIFILLNSAKVLTQSSLGMSYPVYVLTGTVFFGMFSDGMTAPLRTVMTSKSLLIKVRFPREALIVSAWLQTLLTFLIRIALLLVCLVLLHAHFAATLPLAIIPCFGLMLFGVMIGVLLVPAGALFQDITQGLVLLTSALMLITPVAFAPPASGTLAWIMNHNPLTPLVLAARDLTITGSMTYLPATMAIIAVCLVFFFAGWVLFRLAVPIIIERLGS
jgi:lipopolysaccharide transport system permease protein